jgi:hypothetical protein
MTRPHVKTIRHSQLSRVIKANHELEEYCALHPGSPVAVRRPRISIRNGMWVAALGNSSAGQMIASGKKLSAVLEAFDRVYLSNLRPPATAHQHPRA